MTFRLIEDYSSLFEGDLRTFQLRGRTYPTPSLLEDEDGIRWYLSDDATLIPTRSWLRAASSGAAALLTPLRPEGHWAAMTIEAFMDERQDALDGWLPHSWKAFDGIPSYGALLASKAPLGVVQPLAWVEPQEGQEAPPARPEDGFVHLHTHSEYSLLDGLSKMSEIGEVVVEQGGFAFGIADHGNCAGHPDQQKIADRMGLKPIFGMEAYLVDDRHLRLENFSLPEGMDEKSKEALALRAKFVERLQDYYHVVLFAVDDEGLRNLWAISTEGFRDGLYGKNARVDWDTLSRLSKGVIATTGCLRGPLNHHALLEDNEEAAIDRLGRLREIFGDRLYVEIHANQLPEQVRVNEKLVDLARRYDLPLLAAVDSHYARSDDKEAHRVWLSMQTAKDINDESTLFAGGQDYHLLTEADVRAQLAYLPADVVEESIANTAAIARSCTARIQTSSTLPIFAKSGGVEADVDALLDLCLKNWHKTLGKRYGQDVYEARFEREFPLLVTKGFCGYFLMTAEMTNWAKDHQILVGPGRGSGGGSLVAYLAGITDLDPVDAELLFERFMTEGRTALPDFDVDYPQSKKQQMQQHVIDRYGEDYVVVVGSVIRLKSKGIITKLGAALGSTLPEQFYKDKPLISAIIDAAEGDTAGLGLTWEALWDKAGDLLQPFRDEYPYLFKMADRLVGRVHTFGQHAAGMVISTDESLTGTLPLRRAKEEGHLIAQFDKDVLEELGYVKFDMLTLRNLDTIQDCIDLIRRRRGREINVYEWREEYQDPQVWEEVAESHTLGIFQIETTLGTRYSQEMAPRSLVDLADLVTIVRPGPRNSGLTKTYLNRRAGLEPVTFPDPRMAEVLAKTYGCLLYQEDIMQACMILGGYDSNEADEVRKILGKKKVEKVAAAGQEFVSRAVANGMAADDTNFLWAQMAEFAKYSFNRAHAYAYAVLGYWCAWLKFHYPVEFLTSALSSVDKDRIPDFVKEARRMGFKVLPPDINASGSGFSPGDLEVRYGLDSVKGVAEAAKYIEAAQPFSSFEDFMARLVEPKYSKVNKGVVAILAKVGAFDSLVPNRRGLETRLLADKTGESKRCVFKVDHIPVGAPNDLPCTFDWSSEPAPVNARTGKKLKPKAPPKKCTVACRQYVAPPPVQVAEVEPYTDVDIRQIEQELLGVYLSSTPFDMLTEEDRTLTLSEAQAAADPNSLRTSSYVVAAILTKKRPHTDSSGRTMGFLGLETEVSTLDVVSFNSTWTKYAKVLHTGDFYLAEIEPSQKGFSLLNLIPYNP